MSSCHNGLYKLFRCKFLPSPPESQDTETTKILKRTLSEQIFAVQATVLVWPAISDDLNIPSSRQQWIASAYNLAFGCSMLLWGRLADLLGRRKVFITGAAFITVVTALVPFAPNEVAFDILRALQGLGAAATVPSAVGILSTSFRSGKEKNYAFVAFSGGMAVGSVLGNVAGGVIGSQLGWRWIFWIIACLAACLTTAAFIFIPRTAVRIPEKRHFDVTGAFVVTGGLVMLLYALSEGNIVGWGSPVSRIFDEETDLLTPLF